MQQEKASDKHKITSLALSGLIIFVLALIAAVLAKGSQGSTAVEIRVFEVRLSIPAMVSEAQIHHGFPISTWSIYDRQGREVGEISDYDDKLFINSLRTVLQSPAPVGSTKTLDWELSRMVDKNDHPLARLPEANFTIVKYWDESCKDCLAHHQSATKALQKFLATHKAWRVNVLYVDVNVQKRVDELKSKQNQN